MSFFRRILSGILAFSLCAAAAVSAGAVAYSGSDSYEKGKFYEALNNVALTGNPRDDIVNIAKSQRYYFGGDGSDDLSGTPEDYGKYTEYGRVYNSISSNWCGFFVSWCARQAGLSSDIIKQTGVANPVNFGLSGSNKIDGAAAYNWKQFKNGSYIPQAGDLIFYGSSSATGESVPSSGYSHVGIITGVDYNADGSYWFHTVEGNTSVSGYDDDLRGVEFKTRKVSSSNSSSGYTGYWYVRAFGVPSYGGGSGGGTGTLPEDVFTGKYTVINAENGLIIRSIPSTDGQRLGKIPDGTEVTVTEISDGWGKVNYNDIEGWISLEYAKYTDTPPLINELKVESLPNKTEYSVGDNLLISGLKITAVYEGGLEINVTSNCTFTPTVLSTAGVQTVTATYAEASVTFEVTVKAAEVPPQKVIDLSDPSTYPEFTRTLKYTSPNMTGNDVLFVQMILEHLGYGITADGAYGPATSSAVTAFQEDKLIDIDGMVGKQTWATLLSAINTEEATLTEIIIASKPDKTQYFIGESLDTDGMKVLAKYSDGGQREITDFTLSVTELNVAGEVTVTVTYEGKTAEFSVTVSQKEISLIPDSGYVINKENSVISGVKGKTELSDFIANFKVEVTVTDKDGEALAEGDTVGTGCMVLFAPFGEGLQALTVIVKGDLSGDGKSGSVDFMRIRSAYLNSYTLSEAEALAADANSDGKINSTDFMLVRRHFLGLHNIFE